MKKYYPGAMYIRYFWASILAMLLTATTIFAEPIVRTASGANAAAIQTTVNNFKLDLGGTNNGDGGSYTTGRRQISWDDVPDNQSVPNVLDPGFFNSTSPRGVVFGTACHMGRFLVSSRTGTSMTPRFAGYHPEFSTYSSEKLFTIFSDAFPCTTMTVDFFIPGTDTPATVSGFGMVFADVDLVAGSRMVCYDAAGNVIWSKTAAVANGGLSFVGVSFKDGQRIAQVQIAVGSERLGSINDETQNLIDKVVMDDLIYGEPRALNFHPGDFDGDGAADISVFRPATGDWFVLQSGTNTARIDRFGTGGDVPISGDFDGDMLADTAIYRPSSGQWWFKRSTNGTSFAAAFGSPGDKPVPGDFDKDGKTDFAVFRPSTNLWYVLKSSSNFTSFYAQQFGAAGDVPVGAAVFP